MANVLTAMQKSAAYLAEVRAELRKVTWPSWEDLRRMTVVITIFVIIIGLIIGLMDWLSTQVLIHGLGRLFQ